MSKLDRLTTYVREKLNDHEIKECLGKGAYGTVYRVAPYHAGYRFPDFREEYALKLIEISRKAGNPSLLTSKESQNYADMKELSLTKINNTEIKFMYEMRKSHYIVELKSWDYKDYDDDDGNFGCDMFLKMELLECLPDRAQNHTFDEHEIIKLGMDMCRALMACHNHVPQIIHRDIKPSNIFYDKRYDSYKLGDFGVADIQTSTGSVGIFTQEYAAPEQYAAIKSEDYDYRVDIYSVGLTMYFIANGGLPFLKDPSSPQMVEQAVNERLSCQEGLPPLAGISRELMRVIQKATSYQPEDRFQSAEDFLMELENVNYRHIMNKNRIKQAETSSVRFLNEATREFPKWNTRERISAVYVPKAKEKHFDDLYISGRNLRSLGLDETNEPEKQLLYIREKLPLSSIYDTRKPHALLKEQYIGREWLMDKVEAWMQEIGSEHTCVLYGEAGIGKSALAAQLIYRNPRTIAGIFCEYDKPFYNDAKTFTQIMAYLMARLLPCYRQVLVNFLQTGPDIGGMDEQELFSKVILQLSEECKEEIQSPICIMIDGLDEYTHEGRNDLALFLSRNMQSLPEQIKVFVLTRSAFANDIFFEPVFTIYMQGKDYHNLDDIYEYYKYRLKEKYSNEQKWIVAIEKLTRQSNGIFLYAKFVSESILRGYLKMEDLKAFPGNLAETFVRCLEGIFASSSDAEDLRNLLEVLLAAPAPIPEEEVMRILHWKRQTMQTFLSEIEMVLRYDLNIWGNQTISFSHRCIVEWLESVPGTENREIHKSAGQKRMAKEIYAYFKKAEKNSGKNKRKKVENSLTEYEKLFLPELLQSCGMQAEYQEFSEVMTFPKP